MGAKSTTTHDSRVRELWAAFRLLARHPQRTLRLGHLHRLVNHPSRSVVAKASAEVQAGGSVQDPLRLAHAAAVWAADLEEARRADGDGIRDRYATAILILTEAIHAVEAAADTVSASPNNEAHSALGARLARYALAIEPLQVELQILRDNLLGSATDLTALPERTI